MMVSVEPHWALPQPNLTEPSSLFNQLVVSVIKGLLLRVSLTLVLPALLISGIPHVNVGFSAKCVYVHGRVYLHLLGPACAPSTHSP